MRPSHALLAISLLAGTFLAQAQTPPPTTLASLVEREITGVEKQVIDAAEAMPEEKFNFTPESLTIPGDDYKGVRSFAVQVKHIASSNYFLWSPITGDAVPASIKDGNGPTEMKSKADILKFLKESFAYNHYGQMVEYLRMNGIVPPASRGKSD